MATVHLPCGCTTEPTHHSGERLVTCKGSMSCPGGRGYVVGGTLTVAYTVTPWSPV